MPVADIEFLDRGGYVDMSRLKDGRIACCICFAFRTRDQLESAGDGRVWDVCRGLCAVQAEIIDDEEECEMTEQHDDFFTPGATYIQNKPFRAPEALYVFRCAAAEAAPGTSKRYALGFVTTAYASDKDRWVPAAYEQMHWEDGWVPAAYAPRDGWVPASGRWDPDGEADGGADDR